MGNLIIKKPEKQRERLYSWYFNLYSKPKINIKEIPLDLVNYMYESGFFAAPASTKYHEAYEGGLYDHSMRVTACLQDFESKGLFCFGNERSSTVVGLLHDICKMDMYEGEEGAYRYANKALVNGHGSKSVQIIGRFMDLTEEEMLCIRYHMGAYEKDDWDYFDRVVRKYPSVLWTHQADMVASKLLSK